MASCLFYAFRKSGMTRSPKEIAEMFKLKYTEFTKGCKHLLKLIKMKDLF